MIKQPSKKILLVDDDPSLQMMLGDFLLMNGYEVVVVGSGEDALGKMSTSSFDLVILDMGMPGMGGVGFLESITDNLGRTRVPVLVLTARSAMAEFFAGKQIGGFLTKPADPDQLLEEVQRIIFMAGDLPRDGKLIAGTVTTQKTIVLADNDDERRESLRKAMLNLGYNVEAVTSGIEAIESTIACHPSCLVMPLTITGMAPAEVISLLHKMPGTINIPTVVYGVDCHSVARPDLIASIPTDNTELVSSYHADVIIAKVLAFMV